ncbi:MULTISPECIES: hypothetical protein [Pseudomonas]|uniref:hypothetical protein n=1 Tax=Pseudomonas TaxID=286 RepID=UPI00110C81AE|nr:MULTISPECIES: hypothetical protein [Pseudomonas]MBK3444171.1 hypothetical protein [Pseudomonas lactis]
MSSQIGWCIAVLIANEKGADLFKLEFKGALNKSVPFFTFFIYAIPTGVGVWIQSWLKNRKERESNDKDRGQGN